jgi:hypothetical protein
MRGFVAEVMIGLTAACWFGGPVFGQSAKVVEFPDPGAFYGNTTFAVDGSVGYVPTYDNDVLWSFSLETGELLDPDGLALPSPGTASDPFLFPGDRLVIPGWFPGAGALVADVSDPANLAQVGIISLPAGTNIQGQNVEVDDNGYIGYVASFPNDTLYSFNIDTLSLEDPDGLALPGNPDRIALGGDRVAMVDTTNGRIMVADVSDPANMTLAGVIELPGTNSFGSDDNIVFAADGHTGFVTDNTCVLFSFDVLTLTVLDPDGVSVAGAQYLSGHLARYGDTLACLWARGLTFVDISDPTNLSVTCQADFGGTVSTSPGGTVAFTADGTKLAVPVCWPGARLYAFEVATGELVGGPFDVDPYSFYTTVYGPGDRVGTLISDGDARIWLVSGMFGVIPGDIDGDGDVDLADLATLLAAYGTCDGDPDYNPAADLTGDRCVDLSDLAELLSHYGEGT